MVELRNEKMSVLLSDKLPVVGSFVWNGVDFPVTAPGVAVDIRRGMQKVSDILIKTASSAESNRATYEIQCVADGRIAVTFELVFSLSCNMLCVDFHNISEFEDFYLLGVKLSRLFTLSGKDAMLAIPAGAGRLLNVEKVECRELGYQIGSRYAAMLGCAYNKSVFCALETNSYENTFFCEVFEREGARFGGFSVEFVHRLAEFELIEYGHRVPAISPEYCLKVQDDCRVTLTFGGGKGTAVTWLDASCTARDRYPNGLKEYYKDKIIGKICADNGTGKERMTFKELESVIRRYAALTNNQPAVFYLVGWQYNGHDTGYPAIEEVNKNLGAFEALLSLIKTARELNVTVSFHDNYDDAYMNSPDWDPDIISQDAGGNFMKCGYFVQGQAYLISNYKYARHVPKRVKRTVERYGIRDSYHIDVLAGAYKGGRRYDFNPKSPAAAKKNLEGKLMVIDEFAKYGVDVTTEDFSSLFIGRVSHFWHMGCEGVFFKGEEIIPLVPFTFHALASWGLHGASKRDVCLALLHGACFSSDITATNFDECIDMYYLVSMPWMKLYGKKMVCYSKDGAAEQVIYEDGSLVSVNFETESYSVTVDGEVIAKDYTTCIEQSPGIYLAYSRYGGEIALPEKLTDADARIERLAADGTAAGIVLPATVGHVSFVAEPGASYRIIA